MADGVDAESIRLGSALLDSNALSPRAARQLARVAERLGDWKVAAGAMAFLPERTVEDWESWALAHAGLGDHESAAAIWEKLIATDAARANRRFDLWLERIPDDGRQTRALEAAVARDFPLPNLRDRAADLFSRQQRWGDAARLLERNLTPDGSVQRAHAVAEAWLRDGSGARAGAALGDRHDPQSLWLGARAKLQADDREGFRRLLAEGRRRHAGWFRAEDSGRRMEPGRLTGSDSCRDCHPNQHRTQGSGFHARTFAPIREVAADRFQSFGERADPGPSGETHRLVSAEGEFIVEAGSNRMRLTHGVGSGRHGITWLARDEADAPWEYRLSHYHDVGWDITPGHAIGGPVPGRRLGTAELLECYRCHNTDFRSIIGPERHREAERGVRCESCHGPGEFHVKLARAGDLVIPAIRRPRTLTAAESVAICAACHEPARHSFPPESPLASRFQSIGLKASKCFTKSGSLSCVSCHDPHAGRVETTATHNRRCINCHTSFERLPCPKDRGTDSCIGCHMPPTPSIMPHSRFADHFIRVHQEPARAAPSS